MRNRQFIMQCVYIKLFMGECCSFNYARPFGTAFEDTISEKFRVHRAMPQEISGLAFLPK